MKILLDTQIVVWYVEDETLLTPKALSVIKAADKVYVSPINFYEIAIKLAVGKNAGLSRPLSEVINSILDLGFAWLPMSASHIEAYLAIPLLEDHRDPFDRMLLATALADGLSIVSSDHNFPRYQSLVNVVW